MLCVVVDDDLYWHVESVSEFLYWDKMSDHEYEVEAIVKVSQAQVLGNGSVTSLDLSLDPSPKYLIPGLTSSEDLFFSWREFAYANLKILDIN